jgi:endogenous inhibitor of DNA gyrase (YacG/DUF329 family)
LQLLNATPHKPSRSIACPQCGAPTVWHDSNPHRPFCSERCRLIDLGQWATGAYRIAQEDEPARPNEGSDEQEKK